MSTLLPPSVALFSVWHRTYCSYVSEGSERGVVRANQVQVFNPLAKIEVEPASVDRRFVHLRFTYSNKYWARNGPSAHIVDRTVSAKFDKPEEDTSKWSCTLFEPTIRDNLLYLRHVQSGQFVRLDIASNVTLPDGDVPTLTNEFAFTIVDWDSLVIMPKNNVSFKGHNDMYLSSVSLESLRFSSTDPYEEEAAYEINKLGDGTLFIKSRANDRFWRVASGSIWVTPNSATLLGGALFRPVKVDNTTIALRNVINGRFCVSEGNDDRLACNAAVINSRARLTVEELVLERELLQIRYRFEDARVFDEFPFVVGHGFANNRSDHESIMTITVSEEDTNQYSFANSLSVGFGFSIGVTTRIPLVAQNEFTFSTEIINSFEWTRTNSQSRTVMGQYQVTVPPMTQARVDYVATRGRCNVPFSYVQRDRLARDGSFVTRDEVDGVFNGVNSYNFHFENVQMSHLSDDVVEGKQVSRL